MSRKQEFSFSSSPSRTRLGEGAPREHLTEEAPTRTGPPRTPSPHVLCRAAALALVFSLASQASAADHRARQTRPIQLGTSGGNVNDVSHAFCCSGTLGSLVTDGSKQYILSNNHVLARVDAATAGEAVDQPGLIDASCQDIAGDYVAHLTRFIPIDFTRGATNAVDCAIAEVMGGAVDNQGNILDVGQVSTTVLNGPPINTPVKKAGRTSGLSTGQVTGLNGTFSVQYQLGCGSGRKSTATFVNQIVFTNISQGGDSGSLIEEDVASCPRPIALLFAGSSSTTIGNPIGTVLSALGVTLVGCTRHEPAAAQAADFGLQHALEVQARNGERLMQLAGVVGNAIGQDPATGRYRIQVYVEHDEPGVRGQIPAFVEDLDTEVVVSGVIEAF